jgi:restriction system protein
VSSVRDTIPDFQTLMLPVLREAVGGERHIGDVVEALSNQFQLTPEQRADVLPSGRQTTMANRVHWAKSYLSKAGLVEATRRGHFRITERGKSVLAAEPKRIDINFLRKYPEFEAFRFAEEKPASQPASGAPAQPVRLTPDEVMRQARDQIEAELAADILARLKAAPPAFFELVVVRLLTAMGYGGSITEAGKALGRSGDGGVDGVIDEDALGLDRIYVQAKRYQDGNPVGAGAIRDSFGALDQFKAGKGLFATTSTFSQDAIRTAAGLSKRIVLVDGAQFARLMIRYGVGCRVEEELFIKKLDEEFFDG